MKITLKNIKIREVVEGYKDDGENGVVGYGGKLNIRPAYQREFIYKDDKRNAVIQTVRKGFPLNTMYWAVTEDGFELMDGQQRTVSICKYVNGDFSVDWDGSPRGFHNLTNEEREAMLDYELSVYVCEGTDKEKLDWFKVINIAGERLTDQELRNAIYTGPWLTDAKRWFSQTGAPAVQDGREKLVTGSPLRQDILETAIKWISNGEIESYMAEHQHDADAGELWQYWQDVFDWVKQVFPNQDSARTKLMKGLDWGFIYNENKDRQFDSQVLEQKIADMLANEDVDNPRYIYEFVLIENPKIGDDKKLNKRGFTESIKQKKYAQQEGNCTICKEHFEYDQMEADHITPWSKGGKTTIENCEMLCKRCNLAKSARVI